RRQPLGIRWEGRHVLVPSFRQLAVLHAVQALGPLGILGPVLLDLREPGLAQGLAALADAILKVVVDSVRDVELRVLRPTVNALGQANFFLAERFAVSGAGVV